MKKEYVAPYMETIELELEGVIAYSTGIGDSDADGPAKVRMFDDDDYDE